MEIIPCEQNSPEWVEARLGLPTASQFSTVLAKGKGGGPSKTRRTYLYKLAGERITGQPAENFRNAHMDRGHAMEPEARELYEFAEGVTVERVGFIKNHGAGASPDSLVGDHGLLEIKTAMPHILIEYRLAGRVPSEHVAQVQGQLWVTERSWCDLLIYWPRLDPFQARIERDDSYIEGTLRPGVLRFIDELDELVARLSGGAAPEIAPASPEVDLSTAPPAF